MGKYICAATGRDDFPFPEVIAVNSMNMSSFEYALLLFGSRQVIMDYFGFPQIRLPTESEISRATPNTLKCVIEFFNGKLPGMNSFGKGKIYVSDFFRNKRTNIIFPVFGAKEVDPIQNENVTDFVLSDLISSEKSATEKEPRFFQINPESKNESVITNTRILPKH